MIIDWILDRKDGSGYNAREFYCYCNGANEAGNNIARAMDAGNNKDVQKELCRYIITNDYNPAICEYINKEKWI